MHSDHHSDLLERDRLFTRAIWNQKELDMMERNFRKGRNPATKLEEMLSEIEKDLEKVIRRMHNLKEIIRNKEILYH